MADMRSVRRLIMVGACYVDTILEVPNFPQEDHKLRATSFMKRRGGNVANALEVLAQLLPLPCILQLLCVLPARQSGGSQLVRKSLDPRIDLSLCIYREGHTEPASSYIIKANDTGSRTIVNYNELPELTFVEFQYGLEDLQPQECMWVHFEGREMETMSTCIKWLRSHFSNLIISIEAEKPNRPGLDVSLHQADVVFFSKTWAESQGFDNAADFLSGQERLLNTASLLFCTWGADGACVMSRDGMLHSEKAYVEPNRRVLDTIGAGDTFTAGVLYQLLAHGAEFADFDMIKNALKFGNHLAGLKVLQEGFQGLGTAIDLS